MKSDMSSDKLAQFLAKLGESQYLDADYGTNRTGAYSKNCKRTFQRLGYEATDGFSSSTLGGVMSYLSINKHPLLVKAKSDRDGHLFNCDGFMTYTIQYGDESATDLVGLVEVFRYVHFVWGWRGSGNGYYLWGTDYPEVTAGNPYYKDEDDFGTALEVEVFKNFEWYGDFRPNNN